MRVINFIFALSFLGCTHKHDNASFAKGYDLGAVEERLHEASGLTASIANPGHLWTVNDSGNPAEVFLIDDHARIKLVCTLQNIENRDWEEIAIGNGPVPGKKYLYVAEIGDNQAIYEYKYFYRFEEPTLKNGAQQIITNFETLVVKLPDGKRDTETVLIDPLSNDLYIISKREENVNVYQERYPYAKDTLRPVKVMTLPYKKIVAGSISPDGQEVLIKNYNQIFYWKRSDGQSLIEVLAKKPVELPYDPEPQGESISWNLDASGFYTLSESPEDKRAQLKFHKRLK